MDYYALTSLEDVARVLPPLIELSSKKDDIYVGWHELVAYALRDALGAMRGEYGDGGGGCKIVKRGGK